MGHEAQVFAKGIKGRVSFKKEEPGSKVSGYGMKRSPTGDIWVGEWGQSRVHWDEKREDSEEADMVL